MHRTITPVTQKARGIVAIHAGCSMLGLDGPGSPLMVIPGSFYDCRTSSISWPMFARPCPFRPRHGFVDSVRVYSWASVIDLLQRAKSAEPDHPIEIVLAPALTGTVSAVATNAGVTWGRGNDGVTAGRDPHALFIPVKTSKAAWCDAVENMLINEDTFDIPKFPYLEIVENEGTMRLVQVRDGPEQPEGVNHVVRKMKVRRVVEAKASIDLLTWEGLVHLATKEKGTVIWAPGMSLASHFCVHGIESGVPVITDHEVKVGDVILPTKNRTSALGKHEYTKVAALITETLNGAMKINTVTDQKDAIVTAIAATQAQFCWGKEPHLLRLRGLSVAVLLKAVLASCAGEIRHWPSSEGPRTGDPSLYRVLDGAANYRFQRSVIYGNVFNGSFTLSKMKRVLTAAANDLAHESWNRAYGGRRWAAVANTGIKLAQAVKCFCDRPCAASWSKVVQKANRLINTSHNNGKCLTKWVEGFAMATISKSPTAGFLNPYVVRVALKMTDEEEKS